MTKRRLLSSVTAAATVVGGCLLFAPAAQAQAAGCTNNAGNPIMLSDFLFGNFTCTGTDVSTGQPATVQCASFVCARL